VEVNVMESITAAAAATPATPTTRQVICIARMLGAGGPHVGVRVAEELGYSYVDEDIVHHAAASGGVSVEELDDVARRKSFLEQALQGLATSAGLDAYMLGLAAVNLPPSVPPNPRTLRALIRRSILETAGRGNVVIVSHAASYALADRDDVLRVLVTASPATRRARTAAAAALCERRASKAVAEDDAGRAAYLRAFYNVVDEVPTHYDLTLNSDTLSIELMAQLVVRAASAP
jgi:cytidylate kinase